MPPKLLKFLNEHIGVKVLFCLYLIAMIMIGMWVIRELTEWWAVPMGVLLIPAGVFGLWSILVDSKGGK